VAVRPELVCEVAFDHLQGNRFRHASRFLRWRPDRAPDQCGYDQLLPPHPFDLGVILNSRA
jgi:ATP-dependent DNA ligase